MCPIVPDAFSLGPLCIRPCIHVSKNDDDFVFAVGSAFPQAYPTYHTATGAELTVDVFLLIWKQRAYDPV